MCHSNQTSACTWAESKMEQNCFWRRIFFFIFYANISWKVRINENVPSKNKSPYCTLCVCAWDAVCLTTVHAIHCYMSLRSHLELDFGGRTLKLIYARFSLKSKPCGMWPNYHTNMFMTNLTIVYLVQMEYGWNFSISGLKIEIKRGLEKIFMKFLKVQAIFY